MVTGEGCIPNGVPVSHARETIGVKIYISERLGKGGRVVVQNVGPLDRTTRIVMGLVIILYRYIGRFSGIGWDLAIIGGALLIWEGLLGYCLLYGIFGIKTRNR